MHRVAVLYDIHGNAPGGVVIAADGDFDTSTSTGRLMRDFVLRLAQYYREQVAERWEEAHTSMIERGVHSGAAPVGYKKGPDKILVPNGNAEQIREAFRMRVNGANWGAVARYLTEKGVPPKSGKTTWAHGAARKLLDNRAYLGEARHGDKVKTFAHEPLVNESTFHLANHKSARLSGERGDGRLLGGGLCRCGTCGGCKLCGGSSWRLFACRHSKPKEVPAGCHGRDRSADGG